MSRQLKDAYLVCISQHARRRFEERFPRWADAPYEIKSAVIRTMYEQGYEYGWQYGDSYMIIFDSVHLLGEPVVLVCGPTDGDPKADPDHARRFPDTIKTILTKAQADHNMRLAEPAREAQST